MSEVLTPEVSRPTARRAQTRDRLMAAAVTVFADRGIIGASVEEICEAAGFSRGAFYSNFADKDALVLALVQQGMETQYAAAQGAIARSKSLGSRHSPYERVAMVLTEFETVGRPGREAILVEQELLLYAARRPELREPYLAYVEECLHQLRSMIADAVAYSGLEFTCSLAEALELLIAAHNHVNQQSLFTGTVDSTMMQTLLRSITRPIG